MLRARNSILPEGIIRSNALLNAAESEYTDDELEQVLRHLVPDFHPHPTHPIAAWDGDERDFS
ncbi:MAG: hypothetical protein M3Z54_04630 [Gemmatimonadota bacterium]|nr:hypothetical protein [Gemmatimonadota bacterium]